MLNLSLQDEKITFRAWKLKQSGNSLARRKKKKDDQGGHFSSPNEINHPLMKLRDNRHQSRAEKEPNHSYARFGNWLLRTSGICGSRGGRRVCAGTGARGSGLGAGCCGSGGRIESSVAEDVVVIATPAGKARLELVDILALGETVDAAVIVVLGNLGFLAASIHHIGHVPTNNSRTGCIGRGDLPDAAATSSGCAHGRGGSGRHFGY